MSFLSKWFRCLRRNKDTEYNRAQTDLVARQPSGMAQHRRSSAEQSRMNDTSRSRGVANARSRREAPPMTREIRLSRSASSSSSLRTTGSLRNDMALAPILNMECPLCNRKLKPSEVNTHLENCLNQPPRIPYNDEELAADKEECVICLEEMEAGQVVSRLPCLCIYHKCCIEEWFKRRNCCPEHPDDYSDNIL